jgi:hypothetical protein
MPETGDLLLESLEQLDQAAVEARQRGDFTAATSFKEDVLAALPADGALASHPHTEWLQRFVGERAQIGDATARRRIDAAHERERAAREQHWAGRDEESARMVARAVREAQLQSVAQRTVTSAPKGEPGARDA